MIGAAVMATIQVVADGFHTTIVTTFDDGTSSTFSARPSALPTLNDENAAKILSDAVEGTSFDLTGNLTVNVLPSGTVGNNPAVTVFQGDDAAVAQKVALMQQEADFINQADIPYEWLTANCETGTRALLDAAGLSPILPTGSDGNILFAPGFYVPLSQAGAPFSQAAAGIIYQYYLDNLMHRMNDGSGPNTVPSGSGNLPATIGGLFDSFILSPPTEQPQLTIDQLETSFLLGLGGSDSQLSDIIFQVPTTITTNAEQDAGSPPSLFGNGPQKMAMLGGPTGGNTLDGSSGGVVVAGFGGDNRLIGAGNDVMLGGSGANTFAFGAAAVAAATAPEPTFSTILDYNQTPEAFNPDQGDEIDVSPIVGVAYNHGSGEPVGSLVRALATPIAAGLDPIAGTDTVDLQVNNAGTWVSIARLDGLGLGDPVSVRLDPSIAVSTITVQQSVPVTTVPILTAVTASEQEATAGQAVTFTLTVNQGVTVTGTPTLGLGDGGTATYDPAHSNPATGSLVFDYTVGTSTPDLRIVRELTNGGTVSVTNSGGTPADLLPLIGASTGLQVGPAFVTSLTPGNCGSLSVLGDVVTGQSFSLTVAMSEGVSVDTSGGTPSLMLNDAGSTTYDPAASAPAAGDLVFTYTVAPGDFTTELAVTGLALHGPTIDDANGIEADTTAVAQVVDLSLAGIEFTPTMDVNAAVVDGVTASQTGELGAGQTIALTVTLSAPVTIDAGGDPMLILNDGGTAGYAAAASNPSAGTLVFGYVTGTADSTQALAISSIDLPAGTTVTDGSGHPADFSLALDQAFNSGGLQIGSVVVDAVAPSLTAGVHSGQTVALTLDMSGAVTVDTAGGTPTLALNDGATAAYDPSASSPSAGRLVFDYAVGASEHTPTLEVTGVTLPIGSTARDAAGANANFSAALNTPFGVSVNSPLTVTSVSSSKTGTMVNGAVLMTLSAGVTLNTTDGSPSLTLNSGETAHYLGENSPTVLVFSVEEGLTPSAQASTLDVTGVNLNGATITDAGGYSPDFSNAIGATLGNTVVPLTPVLTSVPAGTTFTVGGPVVTLAPALTLTDASNAAAVAFVWISSGTFAGDGDVLSADTAGTSVIANYDTAGEILTLTGGNILGDYETVLKSVTFATDGANPTNSGADPTRTISWLVHDENSTYDSTQQATVVDIACFVRGTRILTDTGEVPIEALRAGDAIRAGFSRLARVTWTGHRRVDCRRHPRQRDVCRYVSRPGRLATASRSAIFIYRPTMLC